MAALFAAPVAALLWMTAVPGKSHEGPLPPLTLAQGQLAQRLRTHVTAIASAPHNLGHPEALETAARYLAAHAPTVRSQEQTFAMARRLHHGDLLYEEALETDTPENSGVRNQESE